MLHSLITASSRRLAFLLTLIVLGASSLVGILSLRISSIECSSNSLSCPSEIEQQLDGLKGHWLFTRDSRIQEQLVTETTLYQVVKVERKLPSTLQLQLQPQSAEYQIRAEQSSEIKSLSQSGAVIENHFNPTAPTLILSTPLWQDFWFTGQVNQEYHQKFLTLMQELDNSAIPVKGVYVMNHQTVALYLQTGLVALIDIHQVRSDLERLTILERNLTLQSQIDTQELDLRYQLPVLRPTLSVPRHEAL